ncbi:unnamed protein product, partial [Symbiodinium sp. CCMP2456]
ADDEAVLLQQEAQLLAAKQAEIHKKLQQLKGTDQESGSESRSEDGEGEEGEGASRFACTVWCEVLAYQDVNNRKKLAKALVDARFNQKVFASVATRIVIVEKEKSLTIQAGWYTQAAMRDDLNYDAKLDGVSNPMIDTAIPR